MIVGVTVALIIIVIAFGIPGIHLFATIPLAPFIAGVAGGIAGKIEQWRIPAFGLIVAGIALVPLTILSVVSFFVEMPFLGIRNDWLFVVASVALVPYIWFGITLGAVFVYLLRRKQSTEN